MRILVTGASGFVGSHFCALFAQEFDIIALSHINAPNKNLQSVQINLAGEGADLPVMVRASKADAVLHLAAAADPNYCEREPEAARRINVAATGRLAQACAELGLPLSFASTDLVFNGESGHYREDFFEFADTTQEPVCEYGRQKREAELLVLAASPKNKVVRLPLMAGRRIAAQGNSFLENFIGAMNAGHQQFLFTDEYRSVCHVREVCLSLKNILLGAAAGVFHLPGPERLSRMDIGQIICQVYNLNPAQLSPVLHKDVQLAAPRPPDCSMLNTRGKDFTWNPSSLAESLSDEMRAHLA